MYKDAYWIFIYNTGKLEPTQCVAIFNRWLNIVMIMLWDNMYQFKFLSNI